MPKNRKQKPMLRPEGLAWLAQHTTDSEWQRCLDLHRVSLDALLTYVQSICDPPLFVEFENRNLPPEVLAERRKAEAEKREAEERASRTIYPGKLPVVSDEQRLFDSMKGRGWHDAAHLLQKERERLAAEEKAERETGELVEIPRPQW